MIKPVIKDEHEYRIAKARPRRIPVFRELSDPVREKDQTREEASVTGLPEPDHDVQRSILAKLRHDLRTPLNAIIGYSEMLLEDAGEQEGREIISDLKNIHSAGIQSLLLVNNILDPSKIVAEINVGLETFGANLRHDLRTPSNAIPSFTEMLLKNAAAHRQKDAFLKSCVPDLEKIYEAAQEFLRLISNAGSFSGKETHVMDQKPHIPDISSRAEMNAASLVNLENGISEAPYRGDLLVVDDNEMNRDLLSRHLKRQGHRTMLAENGRQALEVMTQTTFDLVLLDIMMPEMNGYEVLQYLKNHDTWRNIPIIMISALDEMASVVRCIEMGAEDYLPKPFDPILLKARIDAVLEKKRLRDKEQLYLKSLEREMEIGRDIQTSFLPRSLPEIPGWEIAARFHPARQVSGDFYDAFQLFGGLGIVIADVCDKGVGAALFMGLFRSLIRAFAELHYSSNWVYLGEENVSAHPDTKEMRSPISNHEKALKTVVGLTNDYIAQKHSEANMFATLFLAVIEPETGDLYYINGGHDAPLLIGSEGMKACLNPTGPAVGMMPNLTFRTGKADIDPGDMLVAFTDGITEALDPDGNLYSKEKLLSQILTPTPSAESLLERIESSLSDHTAGAKQSDDITLLAIRRIPVGEVGNGK